MWESANVKGRMVTRVPRSVTLIAVVSSNARSLHEGRAATAARATIMRARPRTSLESLGPRPPRSLRVDDRDERARRLRRRGPVPRRLAPRRPLACHRGNVSCPIERARLPGPLTTNRDSEYLGLTSLVEHRRSE